MVYLSETERRLGNYAAALVLCEKALLLKPGEEYFRLVRAQVLAGLGRQAEAEKEFLASELRPEARAFGLAYGFKIPSVSRPRSGGWKIPAYRGNPGPLMGIIRPAEKQADKLPVLKPAPKPSRKTGLAELIAQCVVPADKANMEMAFRACQSVVYSAGSGAKIKEGASEITGSDASFTSYLLLKTLGRAGEAVEALAGPWKTHRPPGLSSLKPEERLQNQQPGNDLCL